MLEASDLSPEVVMTDRHPDEDFKYHTSSQCTITVSIKTRNGTGWTLNDIGKLIALLELQRSMLADEPLDVKVTVASPMPREASQSPLTLVNTAQGRTNEVLELSAKTAQ